MAASLVPRIIVLALGAGALGFPDALCVLLDIAGRRRSPLTDIAICVFAMAVVTAQALGAMLLARFVRKAAHAGGDDAHAPGPPPPPPPPPRTDRFAQVTLVVSLGIAFLVSACLLVASGAGGLGLLNLVVADVARKMKSPVTAVLATAAAVLPCARTLLRVFREEDQSQATGRFASMAQVACFTGAAAFLLAVSGGLYIQRASLVGVAAIVGTVLLLARFTFARKARNSAGTGGRAAPASAADSRRFGKLTRLTPYLAVVAFVALICCVVLTTDAPLESEPDGAKDHDRALLD